MSSPDDGLRAIFHRELKSHFAWTAIESGATGQGTADSNYLSRDGEEGWVEHKATRHWTVDLNEFQAAWLHRRARYGGRAWIAVRRRHSGGPRLGAAVDDLYLIPARVAREARAGGLRSPEVRDAALGPWLGGPARWDWGAVAALLRLPASALSPPSGASSGPGAAGAGRPRRGS